MCHTHLSEYFGFTLSAPFHKCATLVFIDMLLVSEEQRTEAFEPSKSKANSETGGAFHIQVLSLFIFENIKKSS
jgi:hypothetical protein